jgi:hypothetical protein
MPLTIGYAVVLLASSAALFIFGFWVGRCARKLPIIDQGLPWTMHRTQSHNCPAECTESDTPPPEEPRWPDLPALRLAPTARTVRA